MAEERVIQYADLSKIQNNLSMIYSNIDNLNGRVDSVDSNLKTVYDEVGQLRNEFLLYVNEARRQHNLSVAETRLVKIRQELERTFGHHAVVRRTIIGVLQADDLGLVKQNTITDVSEELMLNTPGYWLAPCLVAIAAWINDYPELANKALKEAIKRDDEKTSLLFTLVTRRANRQKASIKWLHRYFLNKDEENLDRNAIIVLDAYASGLLGVDSENAVSNQINGWMQTLSEKPGFIESQKEQWTNAINARRVPVNHTTYTNLSEHSLSWQSIASTLEGVNLHANIHRYFMNIFSQEADKRELVQQLDDIMTTLVSEFDNDELPLRKDEKYNKLVIDFDGDTHRAKSNMDIEETAYQEKRDFTQLLTDAAMNSQDSKSSPSLQKFAIALSKNWLIESYNDITAKIRMEIPTEIKIKIENFEDSVKDGKDEENICNAYDEFISAERNERIKAAELSAFTHYMFFGGIAIAVISLLMLFSGHAFLGLIGVIAGGAMVFNYYSKKKQSEQLIDKLRSEYGKKINSGKEIIRALCAEIVDLREEIKTKDAESTGVIEFLEEISPEQYVAKLTNSTRRMVNK